MRPEEVKGVFGDALDELPPLPRQDTDGVVAAGRKRVMRRRFTTGSAVAGVAALALAGAFAFAPGGRAPVPAGNAADRGDAAACGKPADFDPSAPDPRGAMYTNTVAGFFHTEFDGDMAMTLYGTAEEGGFRYDPAVCGYTLNTEIVFGGSRLGDDAPLVFDIAVYDAAGEAPLDERMSGYARCDAEVAEFGGSCTPSDTENGPLIVAEYTGDGEDEDEPRATKERGIVLGLDDGRILSVWTRVGSGPGGLWMTPEQLTSIALAIPVDGEPPTLPKAPEDVDESTDAERLAALQAALTEEVPGAELSGDLTFEELFDDHRRELTATLSVPGEEDMTITVQVSYTESDGANTEQALWHWSGCDHDEYVENGAECTFSGDRDGVGYLTRTLDAETSVWTMRSDEPIDGSPAAIAVRVSPADGDGDIALTEEQIKALVTAIPS